MLLNRIFKKSKNIRRLFGVAKPRYTVTPKQESSTFDPYEVIASYTGTNPFAKYSVIAMETDSLNLGQGFPDYDTPTITRESGVEGIQYEESYLPQPPTGYPALNRNLAKAVGKRLGQDLNGSDNVISAVGCAGVFSTVISSLLRDGDECILFEPFFLWHPYLEGLGVKCHIAGFVFCEETQLYKLDEARLRALITPKVKMITLINPNNPDGKLWTREELEIIRKICLENPHIFVVSDEVYNLFMFDGNQHLPIASLPDMFERTITLYSPGKEFSCTGWRMGVAVGPEYLIKPGQEMLKWTQVCSGSNTQVGAALAYEKADQKYEDEENYWTWVRKDYQKRKDHAVDVVRTARKISPKVITAQGGYTFNCFITDDIWRVPIKYFYENQEVPEDVEFPELNENNGLIKFEDWLKLPNPDLTPDQAYGQWLPREIGVTIIPGTYFYYNIGLPLEERKGMELIRFAVPKDHSVFTAMGKQFDSEIL